MRGSGSTGTVYALVDPRDDTPRYIGETKRPLRVRLQGHLSAKKGKVPPWIAELRAAGLAPQIVALRENVPADELLAAERAEITRIIVAGGVLLNEQATATGREIVRQREEQERFTAERAGWREVAGIALAVLGGPMPPGELPEIDIPNVTWQFMAKVRPGHREYLHSLIGPGLGLNMPPERLKLWHALSREQEDATKELWRCVQRKWGELRDLARDALDCRLERYAAIAAQTPFRSRADASRWLALAAWYLVAVDPWRHLAEIAGLPADGPSFIAWAGVDPAVREALEFLAGAGDGLKVTEVDQRRWRDEGPGYQLGTIAAAYTGTMPAEAIRFETVVVLGRMAQDRQLSSPLASLLARLDPKAIDKAFGRDIAAELDAELGLPPGTSGRVARALAKRITPCRGEAIHDIADRSSQEMPVVALPDYGGWYGRGAPAARAIGALLVRAGLAVPDHATPAEYLARVRGLWAPQTDDRAQQAA